jgi:hypothetical protein
MIDSIFNCQLFLKLVDWEFGYIDASSQHELPLLDLSL